MNLPFLAEISGSGFVHQLIAVLLVALCVAVVYGIGWYFFSKPPFGGIVLKIWNGFFILVGGLIIINFLLSLNGHGFVAW
jgi:hypothetical protein